MASLPPSALRLRIDADALVANWRALDAASGEARAGAAVKASCYGLGVDACVPALAGAGCRDYFVAHWSEGPAVLRHVPAQQLRVLHGPMTCADAAFARASGVRPVIVSLAQATLWVDCGGGPCDLMVDTGINRLGLAMSEIGSEAVRALEVVTLHSHLASAEEDSPLNARQLARFHEARGTIVHREASLANSAGIALGGDYHFALTRPGLALYGGVPRVELADALVQVVRPEAALIQTRAIAAGESVGYNATFTAPRAMRVGVVSMGYADGILRAWGGAAFQHGTARLPMLGKVSMDMIVCDLGNAPDLREGDWVELPYHLPTAAQQTGLSQYELLTLLGRRFAS